MIELIHHPEGAERLGDLLVKNLASGKWKTFRAAVAFAKRSGVKHLVKPLQAFMPHRVARISVGLDQGGTSVEGVTDLLNAIQPTGELWVFHNESSTCPTFHPKVYLFTNDIAAECFIGSGNLTEGGLFTNYEAFVHLRLDGSNANDKKLLNDLEALLDQWLDPAKGTALKVTPQLIEDLKVSGDLLTEVEINIRKNLAKSKATTSVTVAKAKKLFASVPVKAAPHVVVQQKPSVTMQPASTVQPGLQSSLVQAQTGFVITLQNTDVGVGQTSKGTSRRSPELFLPVVCVRANPHFWGWPKLFKPDANWTGPIDSDGFGKMDRQGVRMRLGGDILDVNWWYNPHKKDFRLRNEALRSSGNVGDILRIELADGKGKFDYYVEVIPQGTSLFKQYAALCTNPVKNSKKKFGYY